MLSLQLQLKTLLTKKQQHCNIYYNTLLKETVDALFMTGVFLIHIFFLLLFMSLIFLKGSDRGTGEPRIENGRNLQCIKRLTSRDERYPKGK